MMSSTICPACGRAGLTQQSPLKKLRYLFRTMGPVLSVVISLDGNGVPAPCDKRVLKSKRDEKKMTPGENMDKNRRHLDSVMHHSTFPDLSARDLLAVQVLSECRSFMAASLTLNVSQPALTRTIQRVEEVVGLELFRRSTRRVEITAAGTEFAAVASRILSDLRISLENMRDTADEQRGQLIVACVMSIAYMQLPRLIQRYRSLLPRVEIHLREGIHGDVVEDVRSGVADLGITYVDDVPGGCEAISLGHEAFHVVLPQDHVLAQHSAGLSLAEAATYAMVSLPKDSQTRRMLDGLASAAGISLQHAVTVNQFATVMQCVRAGVGLAIVPGGAVPAALASGLVSRPLKSPAVTRTVGVLLLTGRPKTPSAAGFISQVHELWPRLLDASITD